MISIVDVICAFWGQVLNYELARDPCRPNEQELKIQDLTPTFYDAIFWGGIAVGLAAALIHAPIDERPLARLAVPAAR